MESDATHREPLALPGKTFSTARMMRATVAIRVALAAAGGYLVAALVGIVLAQWLPWPRADNVIAGMLAALVVWPLAAMFCCACRSTRRACVSMAAMVMLLAAVALSHGWIS